MIKSTIDNMGNKENTFPKLMISPHGVVVLFTSKCTATLLTKGMANELGTYTDIIDIDYYNDFNGSITLSNEV